MAEERMVGGEQERKEVTIKFANLDLYMQTYDRAIRFAQEYPDTLWCYGNHDLCYPWNQRESGYSKFAVQTV